MLIAAYNEGPRVGEVVAELRSRGYGVVVVDDGSTDATAAEARQAGAVVVSHPINLGQGAALQTALDYARLHGARWLVTFDADGQHRADDIEALLEGLVESRADFALGSRFLGDAVDMPAIRKAIVRLAAVLTRLSTGLRVTDAHNGIRAMTRQGAEAIRLRQNRMAHASELLDQIARSGLKHVEVPVTIEYSAYSLAKGQRLSNAFGIVLDLFMRKLHR